MSNLISKQKAIEAIREFQGQVTCDFPKAWEDGMNEGFDHAVGVIDLMDTVEAPQWIPVSERLPEFGVDVLVCNDEGVQVTAKRTEWSIDPNCWAINYCGYDYDSWDFMTNGAIVAWMPLPQPYKEKEE